ncbi:MAG: hypothetical protein PF489_08260 [Salinivirgaceae bacterium]|jgi:hypothetical protein|nr:hypothetical protein [Salinivirgaceae bacterium]
MWKFKLYLDGTRIRLIGEINPKHIVIAKKKGEVNGMLYYIPRDEFDQINKNGISYRAYMLGGYDREIFVSRDNPSVMLHKGTIDAYINTDFIID